MNRENLLFAIIGLLLGFIVGFIFASSMGQQSAQPTPSAQGLPADHPPVGRNNPNTSAGNPMQMQQEVTAQLELARNEPKNFDAQVKAAQLYFQISRYDQAVEYLLKANQLRPDDVQTMIFLGLANLDAGKYDASEKWYRAALQRVPNEVSVLAGLTAATLGKGDVKAAEEALAKLEKADPNVEDIPRFRERLAALKAR